MHTYPAPVMLPGEAAALTELRQMIEDRYPTSSFAIMRGEDPPGWYLEATVDVDDTDEVWDIVVDRMIDLQVEDGLDVFVSLRLTPDRVEAQWREYFAARSSPAGIAP